ncbi:hypothetical protein [Undibacterium sp. TJN19]|uniref:hypothetical protein n=1 Tax=Undibacterium sp. TJN19 TaxID=3413055 RepID=UPI003BF30208
MSNFINNGAKKINLALVSVGVAANSSADIVLYFNDGRTPVTVAGGLAAFQANPNIISAGNADGFNLINKNNILDADLQPDGVTVRYTLAGLAGTYDIVTSGRNFSVCYSNL